MINARNEHGAAEHPGCTRDGVGYTELYDFAPAGYFSIDETGRILEANLTGAALLGIERSKLFGRPFLRFVFKASHLIILPLLKVIYFSLPIAEPPGLGGAQFTAAG